MDKEEVSLCSVKLKVYGRLARFLGERSFEAEISTPLHAFKFLLANFPHFRKTHDGTKLLCKSR